MQQALSESKLQAVKAQLERRGVTMKATEALALKLPNGEQLLIPFGERAHLVWTRSGGQTTALGLLRQGNQTLNLSADGSERRVRMLEGAKAQRLLGKLREKTKFQEFEQKLREKGKRVAENKLRVLLDETNHLALIGLPNEGSEEILHQLRIRLKANKDDELDDNAEPQIQATACGKATGEALASAATLQPQFEGGEGGSWGGYEGPQICTSQWGYSYSCTSTTPVLSLSSTSVQVATFAGQALTASVTIWNSGGGTLSGTASVGAPFSIVTGGSFSLGPGQPQTVTVRFSPTATGGFSGNLQLSSNGGTKTVALTGGTISVSPAQLSYTAFVGSPQEQKIALKNDGAVAATVTLSGLSAPYALVNAYHATVGLSGGQRLEVGVRFDPTASGTFNAQTPLSLSGTCVRWSEEVLDGRSRCLEQSVAQGSVNAALAGTAHKIKLESEGLDFDIVFLNTTRKRRLIVKNEGATTIPLSVTTSAPFSITTGSSFTLAPSASQEVTAEISPTISRTYMEKLRLTSGSAGVEVPVVAAAMTREEYRERLRALLRGHNEAARQGFHNVAFAESWHSRCLHVFSGFRDLSLEQVESDINGASCEDIPETDPVRLEEIEHAFEILEELGAQQIGQWLRALKQALTEGRFDAEYQRLLPEGLGQFMEAKRLLLDLANASAEEMKGRLKNWLLEQQAPEFITYIKWLQDMAKLNWEASFWWSITHRLDFNLVILPEWNRILLLMSGSSAFANEMVRFSHAMYYITLALGRASPMGVVFTINQFISFLQWMDSGPRLEQGFGTLFAAAHAAFQGWNIHRFSSITNADGQTAWVAELKLSPQRALELGALVPMTRIGPDGTPYDLKGIHATVLGHHCQQCGHLGPQIMGQIMQAMNASWGPGNQFTTRYNSKEELNVYIVSFTRENPQGVGIVVEQLKGALSSSNAVVMVVWIENGQVKWACVSAGCTVLNLGEQEAIARSFANLISQYPRHAVGSAMMVCGGDLDCMREVLKTLWPECSKGGCQTLGQMSRWQYSGIMGVPRREEPVC